MNRSLPTFKEGENGVKISHFTRKGYDINGIIHIGTNDWYEYPFYKKMGIDNLIGFEPLPEAVERARKRFPGVVVYQVALGNIDGELDLLVASGDGQSSSFLDLTPEYSKEFPDIELIKMQGVKVKKFTTWLNDTPNFKFYDYDTVVIDVEGFELEVLKGMGETIRYFKFLNIECSGEPTYKNGPTAREIIDYLETKGFQADSPIEAHNDIMFINKEKVN